MMKSSTSFTISSEPADISLKNTNDVRLDRLLTGVPQKPPNIDDVISPLMGGKTNRKLNRFLDNFRDIHDS